MLRRGSSEKNVAFLSETDTDDEETRCSAGRCSATRRTARRKVKLLQCGDNKNRAALWDRGSRARIGLGRTEGPDR